MLSLLKPRRALCEKQTEMLLFAIDGLKTAITDVDFFNVYI